MNWDKPLLVTGATGLIGKCLTHKALLSGIPVCALVRDIAIAKEVLGQHPLLEFIQGDISQPVSIPHPIGAMIHAANPTDSKSFIEDPIGTILTCIYGTRQMLAYSLKYGVRMIYLSSGEIYGQFPRLTVVHEEEMGYLNPFSARSSYPEAKRVCEALCAAYYTQLNLDIIVARMGVIFGPLAKPADNRLIAHFARCACEERDIVLKTKGKTIRSYCYVEDAANALLLLLEKGISGNVYNVANPEMTYSVKEIAKMVSHMFPRTQVTHNLAADYQKEGYLSETKIQLDCKKLLNLGWLPIVTFEEGFRRTCESVQLQLGDHKAANSGKSVYQ